MALRWLTCSTASMPMQRRPSCTGADSTHISTALMDLRTSPPQPRAMASTTPSSSSSGVCCSCSKMAKARSDAKLTEAKLKKVNEQIHYLGQYLSTKSVYADFLKSTNKKDFRQNHADEIAKYEEALQFLKQNSPDGKLPTMKDLRSEKELLVQQKSAQYETHQYFRDYHRELQTVCENVNHILDASQTKQQEQKKSHQSEHSI